MEYLVAAIIAVSGIVVPPAATSQCKFWDDAHTWYVAHADQLHRPDFARQYEAYFHNFQMTKPCPKYYVAK